MKKNKGFTLIELLAVIVILAVIALIATPIIMNVISDAQKGSAKDSAYGYIKAVELVTAKVITATTDAPSGDYIIKDGNLYSSDNPSHILDIVFKGTKPMDDGMIILDKGNVVSATFKIDENQVHYNGKEVLIGNNYGAGEVVFYNPETNKKCIGREVNQSANAKTGCLRWNVITTVDNENKTNIDIMLDHNTTPGVAWVSKEDYIAAGGTEAEYGDKGNSSKGPLTALKQLNIDTNAWFSTVKSTARMISAEEVIDIIGMDSWGSNQTSVTVVPWLYQNLIFDNVSGYWTSTARINTDYVAWRVYSGKMLTGGTVYVDTMNGIRPVITVAKSVFA